MTWGGGDVKRLRWITYGRGGEKCCHFDFVISVWPLSNTKYHLLNTNELLFAIFLGNDLLRNIFYKKRKRFKKFGYVKLAQLICFHKFYVVYSIFLLFLKKSFLFRMSWIPPSLRISGDTQLIDFVEGLGPAQMVGRQVLGNSNF